MLTGEIFFIPPFVYFSTSGNRFHLVKLIMKKLTLAFALIGSFLSYNTICAQSIDESLANDTIAEISKDAKEATKYFLAREYAAAAELYKDAFSDASSRSEKAEIAFRIGECYRHMRDYKTAESQYKRAVKLNYGPMAQFYMAQAIQSQGKYEDAIKEFEEYRKMDPDSKLAEPAIKACKDAVDWKKNPTRYQVTNIPDFNTRQNDFGIMYAGKMGQFNEVFFASTREESTGKKEDGWLGEPYSDIYVSESERKTKRKPKKGEPKEEVSWSYPVPLDPLINTEDHEGVGVFDSRKKAMYFTRCIDVKRAQFGCAIFETRRMGTTWSEPEEVVITQDSSESVGHPALSLDDQILYFSGEIKGTRGGKDLWMTTFDRRAKEWTAPKNLGKLVNTGGDELYPFVHDDGYLYFASNGLPGMGGLDIFRVQLDEEGMPTGEVENMKYPINTEADDFNIIFESGAAQKGYLSSNRSDGRGGVDIYSVFEVPLKFILDGTITSAKDGKPVSQVTVRLDGSDGTSLVVNTDKDGNYQFTPDQLAENVTYKLNFEKKKFLNSTADFTTVGVPMTSFEYNSSENIFLHGFKLNSKMDPIEVPIVLPNVFFDLGKWDLRPEAQKALDSVVSILNNNPNIVIEMRSHTDYRDTDEKNKILSQHRADTCVSYIISKGIDKERLVAVGMGESEPFTIPENYKGYGFETFKPGIQLTENYIKRQPQKDQEVGNQINRRTDFKVLRDDYVPAQPAVEETAAGADAPKEKKKAKPEFYTVGARENIGKIAKNAGVTVRDIKELNGGLRGVRLTEGMVLKITPGADYSEFDKSHYQVQRGEDAKAISEATGVSVEDLENLNPDLDLDEVPAGTYIRTK